VIYGERIEQAREVNGLTQTELAERVGVTQPAIAQLEANRRAPTEALLDRIALVTKFPPAFFREPLDEALPVGSLLYRTRSSVSRRNRQQAYRLLQLYAEAASRLAKDLKTPPVRLPRLAEDPIIAARITRSVMGLQPDQPIPNLMRRLERIGVLIFVLPLPIEGLDAFSAWSACTDTPPVIGILETTKGDRQRFSLAHETGELVVNYQPRGTLAEMERRANAFAAELLLPEEAMRKEFVPPVTLLSVAEMKPRWGVSIQALLIRARELGIISPRQYKYLQSQISARGWRTHEPENLRVAPERPKAPTKIAELLFGSPLDVAKVAAATNRTEAFITAMLQAQGDSNQSFGPGSRIVPFRAPQTGTD
jgi:Zn-dependent peptidase ImmA (M78 family)/DNA-binding XRE family transcriptional regulator